MDPSEPVIERYRTAMYAAAQQPAAETGPARFQLSGLTLTPGTVMACAVPLDPRADLFMDRLAVELGPDGWHELPDGRRDIWYFNLLHFTTDIRSPTALIDWVSARRELDLGEVTIPSAELVRFRHALDGTRPYMRPEALEVRAL